MVWSQLTQASQNGASPITQYKIYWDSGAGNGQFSELITITNAAQTSYTKTGLTLGTPYKFQIQAINIYGAGPVSASIEIIPATAPDKPTNLQLVSSDTTQITFSWTAPLSGGYPITSYKIYWDNNSNGASFSLATPSSVTGTTTQVTVQTAIQVGKVYQFKVSAVNLIGESQLSNSASFIAAVVPNPPTNIIATVQTTTSIQIAWTAPQQNGGSPITNYKVY